MTAVTTGTQECQIVGGDFNCVMRTRDILLPVQQQQQGRSGRLIGGQGLRTVNFLAGLQDAWLHSHSGFRAALQLQLKQDWARSQRDIRQDSGVPLSWLRGRSPLLPPQQFAVRWQASGVLYTVVARRGAQVVLAWVPRVGNMC
jgi:hypothetical protein